MDWADAVKLIVSVALCEGAGGIGAIFTTPAIPTWYRSLKKPAFTPPGWAFGPVWLTLYLLMAIAVFLVWRDGLGGNGATAAFVAFWVQLALNVLWSVVFFGLRSILDGLITILFLWAAILVTIILFLPVSPVAAGLLVPYIIWVTVATYLNAGIWALNR